MRNNIKLMTVTELKELANKYIFILDDSEEHILVRTKNYSRVTSHDIDKSFRINVVGKRVIVFSLDAIKIWKELYKEYKYSLLYVQNAVNKLYITFQEINKENVQKILSGKDIKITEL